MSRKLQFVITSGKEMIMKLIKFNGSLNPTVLPATCRKFVSSNHNLGYEFGVINGES